MLESLPECLKRRWMWAAAFTVKTDQVLKDQALLQLGRRRTAQQCQRHPNNSHQTIHVWPRWDGSLQQLWSAALISRSRLRLKLLIQWPMKCPNLTSSQHPATHSLQDNLTQRQTTKVCILCNRGLCRLALGWGLAGANHAEQEQAYTMQDTLMQCRLDFENNCMVKCKCTCDSFGSQRKVD